MADGFTNLIAKIRDSFEIDKLSNLCMMLLHLCLGKNCKTFFRENQGLKLSYSIETCYFKK